MSARTENCKHRAGCQKRAYECLISCATFEAFPVDPPEKMKGVSKSDILRAGRAAVASVTRDAMRQYSEVQQLKQRAEAAEKKCELLNSANARMREEHEGSVDNTAALAGDAVRRMTELTQRAEAAEEKLRERHDDWVRGMKIAYGLTLETQTFEEACSDLVRMVRELRESRNKAEVALAAAREDYENSVEFGKQQTELLAAAREENEKLRKSLCECDDQFKAQYISDGNKIADLAREFAALRSRADDAERVERAARMMFKMMRMKLPKLYQFEDEPEWWTGNARILLATADGGEVK